MVIIVAFEKYSLKAFCIFSSVTKSIDAVASSVTIIFERRIIALAIQTSCFSPTDRESSVISKF